MRHQKHKNKLGVGPAHRKSMMRNLGISLIKHGKIKTTLSRCRALRPFIERLVTKAGNDSVANRRLVYSRLGASDREVVQKLFNEIGPKFKSRNGGYTRIEKLSDGRFGDNARQAYISFVE